MNVRCDSEVATRGQREGFLGTSDVTLRDSMGFVGVGRGEDKVVVCLIWMGDKGLLVE